MKTEDEEREPQHDHDHDHEHATATATATAAPTQTKVALDSPVTRHPAGSGSVGMVLVLQRAASASCSMQRSF